MLFRFASLRALAGKAGIGARPARMSALSAVLSGNLEVNCGPCSAGPTPAFAFGWHWLHDVAKAFAPAAGSPMLVGDGVTAGGAVAVGAEMAVGLVPGVGLPATGDAAGLGVTDAAVGLGLRVGVGTGVSVTAGVGMPAGWLLRAIVGVGP